MLAKIETRVWSQEAQETQEAQRIQESPRTQTDPRTLKKANTTNIATTNNIKNMININTIKLINIIEMTSTTGTISIKTYRSKGSLKQKINKIQLPTVNQKKKILQQHHK